MQGILFTRSRLGICRLRYAYLYPVIEKTDLKVTFSFIVSEERRRKCEHCVKFGRRISGLAAIEISSFREARRVCSAPAPSICRPGRPIQVECNFGVAINNGDAKPNLSADFLRPFLSIPLFSAPPSTCVFYHHLGGNFPGRD